MGPIPADSPKLFPWSSHQASSDESSRFRDARYHGGINDQDIALVVSIEMDSYGRNIGDQWRDVDYARSLQIVQWTIMASISLSSPTLEIADEERKAKPYHPVLLDALEMVVRNIERGKAGVTTDNISDAVSLVN